MDKIPSKALCAHVHDSFREHGTSQRDLDAFVSTIYDSDRTIDVCKEIAQLCKSIVSGEPLDCNDFHHLPFKRRKGEVVTNDQGLPDLVGVGYKCLNELIHQDQSDVRDKTLILLTKLHAYVLPLKVYDGVARTRTMFENIETPFNVPNTILDRFREHTVQYLRDKSNILRRFNWHKHLMPLHDLSVKYFGSDKKKPSYIMNEDGRVVFDVEATASCDDSYMLPLIMSNRHLRELYESNKFDFLELMTGERPVSIVDDSNLYKFESQELPVGRIGIRLQEAEKVRTLWMPIPGIESLTQPTVEVLETLVKSSQHQTTYYDDEVAAIIMQDSFFPQGKPSSQTIYSIDQSSFTDNFPYVLQKIVLEELVELDVIPQVSVSAFDYAVYGGYKPSNAYIRNDGRKEEVHFAKGTPMGAPGSFMLATLSHEILIDMLQEYIVDDTPFFVQGDDATIVGDQLYELYTGVMSRIGCEVNPSKTMKSKGAFEYCGWISTPTLRCPMFRPHDRFNDHPRDLVSPRAITAFGEDSLTAWIREYRNELLIPLKIAGYLLIDTEEDDPQVLTASCVAQALGSSNNILQPGMSPEQTCRLFLMRSVYPNVIIDEDMQSLKRVHLQQSDNRIFSYKISKLKRLRNKLINDPMSDLIQVSNDIIDLCDDISSNHNDRLSVIHPPQKREDDKQRETMNPFKPKWNHDKSVKTARDALDIVQRAHQDERSEVPNDENDLQGP